MSKQRKPLLHHLSDYFFPHARNNHRPHLFSLVSVAVLVFAVFLFEGAYLVQTKFVFLRTDFLASVLPGALVALTNNDRTMNGLSGVTEDALLDTAAQAAAEDMATKGYFAHVSPDGKDPWYWLDSVGYKYSYAGENLAVNFTDSENVETAWMASPTHHANIVKPEYTKVGFGTANGMYEGKETTFVVSFFATPPTSEVVAPTVTVGAVALANSADIRYPQEQASTTVAEVLGSQVENTPAPVTSAPTHSTPASLGLFAILFAVTSPLNMLITVLALLFVIIASSFAITAIISGKSPHPAVLAGGTFLLVLITGAMLFSFNSAGNVQLNSQAASVYTALQN